MAEINEIKTKKKRENQQKQKLFFSTISNRTDKPLGGLTKKRRERAQITRIRNEEGKLLWIL